MKGIAAITMAGMGSRFTSAGYTVPKYEIEALGRPLFDWSMMAMQAYRDAGYAFWFAVRKGTGAPEYIRKRCAVLGIEVGEIIEIDGLTDGQATTALMLLETAPDDVPMAVFNIDTYVTPGAMTPPTRGAGQIPCFPGPGEGWSFARLDDAGRVVELREKVRISDHATVGLYWFDCVGAYRDAYERYFATGGEEKGERYIAPLYNQLIQDGADVRISQLAFEDVGMLGTPDQLDDFIANPPPSARALAK
ncbi:glycosyltransferase family 2 protein [Tropicibacter naphthalenivorans]|uniref:Uncharacterized protein n=1 Tax=Tropicibacter naphthalenivorans TaxID=441103 RepID=A0A0P1GUV3_9RHOB|nr:glycosyltransferase family 2 protein [Tropicibacter naphthalenivorans]CUH79478.1 hypothetical protein TRN7648_02493 [Tropicibacter naphthalenivorans]SMC72958.1 dTDP-glucose pyrophosphorylase [Tropicibacter naphthalenivorans]